MRRTCFECGAVLDFEVDDVPHRSMVRCPVCGTTAPARLAYDGQRSYPSSDSGTVLPGKDRRTVLGMDKPILLAVGFGVASIVANFLCCGPYTGLPLSLFGAFQTFVSQSNFRQSGFVLNGIGFAISAGMLAFRFWF